MQFKDLIAHLEMGVQKKYPNRHDRDQPDIFTANATMKRAAIVLKAVFDPENQPSQFGTRLLSE